MEGAINQVIHDIVHECRPQRIIEFGEKRSMAEHIKAVSLCVIIPAGDARQMRRQLHLALHADFPVNLAVYNTADWAELTEDPTSYAAWIEKKGRVVYEP